MSILVITLAILSVIGILTSGWLLLSCLTQEQKIADRNRQIFELEKDKVVIAQNLKKEYDTQLANSMSQFEKKFLERLGGAHADIVAQGRLGTSLKEMERDIADTMSHRLSTMTQTFLGNLTDEAEGLVRDLNMELCERVWDCFQNYKSKLIESPALLPENCKMIYTKGNRTVVVIEQKPQVRTVAFEDELISNKTASQAVGRTAAGDSRYTLAFPYVYFICVFDSEKCTFFDLYFRNKPLTTIREHIYLPPLPNIWRDGQRGAENSVCMGPNFWDHVWKESGIVRQCDLIISNYWQRSYNGHLGDGDPQKTDKRIRTPAIWQAETVKDPLFILSVDWKGGKTVKGVIEGLLDKRSRLSTLDPIEDHIRKLLDSGVEAITNRVKAEVAKAKEAGLTGPSLDHQANVILQTALLKHSRYVIEHCLKEE